MKLPSEIREQFRRYGQVGGQTRASVLSPERRRAIASRAAALRWIRKRFGGDSFEELGLPGGDLIDAGLADLTEERPSLESLLVSIAAPRLRREGVPVGSELADPEDRLYELLAQSEGDLAHARYQAYLGQASSFANACQPRRLRYGRSGSLQGAGRRGSRVLVQPIPSSLEGSSFGGRRFVSEE